MTITLTIQKAVFGGYGLGFAQDKTWLVPFALPGDNLVVKETRKKKKLSFASIEKILTPSPMRIEPLCPNFMLCGGCSYQHISYKDECALKGEIILDQLTRIGKYNPADLESPMDVITADHLHYRDNTRIHSESGKSGFFAQGSHTVVPLPDQGCNIIMNELNSYIRENTFMRGEHKISVATDGTICDKKNQTVIHSHHGISYSHKNSAFFQANRYLRDTMINRVLSYLNLSEKDTLYDAGCGCGFFTLPGAKLCSKAIGMDLSRDGIGSANKNSKANNIQNTLFENKSFSTHSVPEGTTKIVLDPPRSGIDKPLLEKIIQSGVEGIVYVSCDPSTWARDVRTLSEHYALSKLSFIDMFPRTHHIELISFLKLK
jgi:23S rRNA (uracil1939-C5)-methyltransferase